MKLYNAEVADIGVTDGSISEDTTATVTVAEASLSKFAVSISSPQINNIVFTGTNTVTAQDTYGNTARTFDASADHVALAVSPSGSLAPTTLQGGDFVNGVANPSTIGLAYTGGSGSRTLTATAATGETGTSAPFTVNPGQVDHFAVTAADGGLGGEVAAVGCGDREVVDLTRVHRERGRRARLAGDRKSVA